MSTPINDVIRVVDKNRVSKTINNVSNLFFFIVGAEKISPEMTITSTQRLKNQTFGTSKGTGEFGK
jgi:hypothetical protein